MTDRAAIEEGVKRALSLIEQHQPTLDDRNFATLGLMAATIYPHVRSRSTDTSSVEDDVKRAIAVARLIIAELTKQRDEASKAKTQK